MLKAQDLSVDYPLDYYIYGQFMKFIDRGAVRLSVTDQDTKCPAVSFMNPDGRLTLVVVNLYDKKQPIEIVSDGLIAQFEPAARSITTLVWRPESK
jgi:glucosylceramidase